MEAEKQVHQPQEEHHTNWHNILKFIGYSFIGAFYVFHSHYDQWFIEYYA